MKNKYFKEVYKQSLKAYKKNEIPVGAVIVKNNKIIAKSHNKRQSKYNLFSHAEIECIIKAEKKIKDWRLNECIMYTTLKPCEMCQIFIKESRINKVYYLIERDKTKKITKNIIQTNDCVKKESFNLLNNFFNNIRN